MRITFQDGIDLQKIIDSGQCFRAKQIENGLFRFVCREHAGYFRQTDSRHIELLYREEDASFWKIYFDKKRDYRQIAAEIRKKTDAFNAACRFGKGIRILRQDTWEMLITFLLSQRKSIPAIRTSLERIAEMCGQPVVTPWETLYLFPSPEALAALAPEQLQACGLGYRAPYIRDAALAVLHGDTDLESLHRLSDEQLFDALCSLHGVGTKIANCVMLFGFHRTDRVPMDVWMNRATVFYGEENGAFLQHGENAGILQQYVFYYALTHKKEFS